MCGYDGPFTDGGPGRTPEEIRAWIVQNNAWQPDKPPDKLVEHPVLD